ncbi:MAG: hypothetical protein Q8N96_06190, partial [Methylovulum sp.]|nr:hypothetical protein [Methylovulum sp.]
IPYTAAHGTIRFSFSIVPTLWRGNAARDAPASRHATPERCRIRYHAERGNDKRLIFFSCASFNARLKSNIFH